MGFRVQFDKIMVVDDEWVIRKSLEEVLRNLRYTVVCASSLAEAEIMVKKDLFDLIFLDVGLPDGPGTGLLKCFPHLVENGERPFVVIVTGHGSIASAVECVRLGAFDYIVKPFSAQEIEVVIRKVESYSQLVQVNRYFLHNENGSSCELIGTSPEMMKVKQLIQKVAATKATVLITGENGTGKELVAREIHTLSSLAKEPYITVNCAAISENLMESEFFGHERGAFTGALQRHIGRFELAHNGTILLDEIAEIRPHLQAKLLRVLQEKEFERVGGTRSLKVDVRILASTNQNLRSAVERGEFREDLYYRLNVFPIEIPPLRERKEDILLLAEAFLKRFARKHGVVTEGFSPEAVEWLLSHRWPGNVRELQNIVERAVILTDSHRPIETHVLDLRRPEANVEISPKGPDRSVMDFYPSPSASSLEEIEREHIFRVLASTHGNRTKAASILGITTRTLGNKLKKYPNGPSISSH
jgi:DNA-binding NtrC family response regulator